MAVKILVRKKIDKKQVIDLYKQNKWSADETPNKLVKALKNAHVLITAWDGEKLVQSVKLIPAKSAVSVRNYRFPIPESERKLNPTGLWQNYGYTGSTVTNPYDESYK